MGFILTLTYITVLYLTPAVLVPALAPFRIQLWIGLAALVCSLPAMLTDRRWRAPQLIFFVALLFWIPISLILGPVHYFGGAVEALNKFLPNGIVLILVVVNCRSVRRLKIVLFALVIAAGYFVAVGARAYYQQDDHSPFVLTQRLGPNDEIVLFRARALGVLNDPNDFAQFLLILLPVLWLGWQRGGRVRKAAVALPLTALMFWGIFLSHSRGAIVGAAVVLLFAFRRKLGNTRAAIVTGCLVLVLLAGQFSGGREVSMEGGEDRISLWSDGLEAFKTSPLFGVGFGEYADATGSGLTAHNSAIQCLTELGVAGYFFWIAPIIFTMFQLHDIINTKPVAEEDAAQLDDEETIPPEVADTSSVEVFDSVRRFTVIVRLSLIGFLATSWFLSRAFSATCWLVLGIAIATVQLAQTSEAPTLRRFSSLMRWSVAVEFGSIAVVYLMVRIVSLGR